jgi:hypothetical protein
MFATGESDMAHLGAEPEEASSRSKATPEQAVEDTNELEEYGDWSAADEDVGAETVVSGVELVDGYPKCPAPTRWRLVSQQLVNGRLSIVSSAVKAKAAPVKHTFKVTRTLKFGASITAGVKASIQIIEVETSIKLSTSVTVSTSESVTYTIPKGKTMALFAGCAFVDRTFERTVYGSAMCNKVVQRTTVRSPRFPLLEVRSV